MGIGELISRRFAQGPAQETSPRIVIWCTWNLTHDPMPEPQVKRGQELIQTICTPCYNKSYTEARASRLNSQDENKI